MSFSKLLKEKSALAVSLDLLGDKWTLLILSASLARITRFNDFEGLLGINRNLLSSRLERLVEARVMEKHLYNDKPKRYEYRITEIGQELRPIIYGLALWSERYLIDGMPPVSIVHEHCGGELNVQAVCIHCGCNVDPSEVTSRLNGNAGEVATEFFHSTRPTRQGSKVE